jgi:hypothetical protein
MNDPRDRLTIIPCSVQDARAYVRRVHRHHDPPVSGGFAVAVVDAAGALRGVAISGRPVARMLQDGWTVEVTRLATDGCPNGCSALYGASRRIAVAMGFRGGLTYTLASESGASLRGAGWREAGAAGGGTWSTPTRERVDHHPTERKVRWEWGVVGGATAPNPAFGLALTEADTAQVGIWERITIE